MKTTVCLIIMLTCVAQAATEEEVHETFAVDPDGTLIVDVTFGSVTVTAGDTSEVTVDVWRRITRPKKKAEEEFLRKNPIQFKQEGNTLTVRSSHNETGSLWNMRRKKNEAKYVVSVPLRFNVDLDTSGGPISVNDLSGSVKAHSSGGGLHFARVNGPLNADTSGGRIDMTDCEGQIEVDTSGGGIKVAGGGGSLDGETSGGGVTVKNFQGDTRVRTSGGGIVLDHVVGEINAHTSGGGVSAVLPVSPPGPVSLSSSGGGITVRVPETAAFELDARSSGGGVSCEIPVTMVGNAANSELKGTVNGGGPTIRLRSSGGGVHVKKL